jgi:hypothetical protein
MKRANVMKTFRSLFGAVALVVSSLAAAVPYTVVVDTTPLAGSAGFLAFDLLAGSAGPGNQLVISDFLSSGTLGAGSGSGSVTGNLLPGPLRLSSATGFFNEWVQAVTFGTQLRFQFSLTENFGGGSPDNFSFYLLGTNLLPLVTTDPSGANSALTFDVTGTGTPLAYASTFFATTVVPVAVVPEPHAKWLMALGLGLYLARGRRNLSVLSRRVTPAR